MDSFIPTVYHRPPATTDHRTRHPHQVQHWLGTIAHHLDRLGTRDIEWWRLGDARGRRTRVLLTGIAAGLFMAIPDLIADRIISTIHAPGILPYIFLDSVLVALCIGLMASLMFGPLNLAVARRGGVSLSPARFELRLAHRWREVGRRFVSRLGIAFACGLLFGFGFGILDALIRRLLWTPGQLTLWQVLRVGLINGIVYALLIGLGMGLVGGLLAALEAPLDIDSAVSPITLLAATRRTVSMQMVVWVPVFGLVIGFGPMALDPLLQPVFGPLSWSIAAVAEFSFVAGLVGGAAYTLSLTAWGQWVLYCRILLPLRGKLPWDLVAFLDDAYRRGVLRQAGAVYQFRHARLQDRLTNTTPTTTPTTATTAPPR